MLRVESSETPGEREELRRLAAALRRHLDAKERAGIRFVSKHSALEKNAQRGSEPKPAAGAQENLFITGESAVHQAKTLEELRAAIGDCRRCKLWSGRTHLVFGVGNPKARVMFVG